MLRKSMGDITDEEFKKIISPFDDDITKYGKENIINQFVAYYIAHGYRKSAIWQDDLDVTIATAIEMLCQFSKKDCNIKELKNILEKEYDLKIINETPMEIEDLRA